MTSSRGYEMIPGKEISYIFTPLMITDPSSSGIFTWPGKRVDFALSAPSQRQPPTALSI
jgi:hypothetical protein